MTLRKEQRLTQFDLADIIGVSYKTIQRWEKQKSSPTLEQVSKLAEIFNVPEEYLMGLQDNQNQTLHALIDTLANNNMNVTTDCSASSITIKDGNSNMIFNFPNNEEGRKSLALFLNYSLGMKPAVSNTINRNNNSDNKLGIINN